MSSDGYSVWRCPACNHTTQMGDMSPDVMLFCQRLAPDNERICGHRLVQRSRVSMTQANINPNTGPFLTR